MMTQPALRLSLLPLKLWVLSALWLSSTAAATPNGGPHAYAIIVGSNPGGPGQIELRYAERDAKAVADVLKELGRVPKENIQLLLKPTPETVLAIISAVSQKLELHQQRGEQARLFFFYSGHAKSDAIHLGKSQLPLKRLRQALLSAHTTLTVAVLDACQSGAFSSAVKGVEPRESFSFNSVSRLNTQGIAVMASSTQDELSQESSELQASYFTHHLLVAMRGAGDRNRDGQVSLHEAYRYAYDQTLRTTSLTPVGGQHVTLETNLKGQGEVPMSYPASAKAQLAVPASLSGQIIVQQPQGGSVLAELSKARGHTFNLALPAGPYSIVLRSKDSILQCSTTLEEGRVTRFTLDGCKRVTSDASSYAKKGDGETAEPAPWGVELGIGLGNTRDHDAYLDRLGDFGYNERFNLATDGLRGRLALTRNLLPELGLVAEVGNLEHRAFRRHVTTDAGDSLTQGFSFQALGASISLRPQLPLSKHFVLYGQLGVGLGLGLTQMSKRGTQDTSATQHETFLGPILAAAGGAQYMAWRNLGFFLQLTYHYAPIITNNLGDTHDSGGPNLFFGTRLTWEKP